MLLTLLKRNLSLGLLLLLTSCSCHRLSLYTDYLDGSDLASAHVGTPDPLLYNPPTGQRLIIKWHIPHAYLDYDDLQLNVTVRFRDHSERTLQFPIEHTAGTRVENFFDPPELITFKANITGNGEILETWTHQLWCELIVLEKEQ